MAVTQRAMTAREWGLLALLSLLWGGSFFFIGVAVKELPPLTLAALRVGLAALILWASAPLTGAAPPGTARPSRLSRCSASATTPCPSP
jgi:drug/metabolite transporter (DMT)-like permease